MIINIWYGFQYSQRVKWYANGVRTLRFSTCHLRRPKVKISNGRYHSSLRQRHVIFGLASLELEVDTQLPAWHCEAASFPYKVLEKSFHGAWKLVLGGFFRWLSARSPWIVPRCSMPFCHILPYFARAWLAWYVWTSQLNHHQPPNHSRALEKGGTPDVAKEVHVFGGLQGRLEGPGQPPEVGVP